MRGADGFDRNGERQERGFLEEEDYAVEFAFADASQLRRGGWDGRDRGCGEAAGFF